MAFIKVMLEKEKRCNEQMIKKYEEELARLPKGKIVAKSQQGRTYFYLQFRSGKKICSTYLGKDEKLLLETEEKLARRKSVEVIIKALKNENQKIQKLEAKV